MTRRETIGFLSLSLLSAASAAAVTLSGPGTGDGVDQGFRTVRNARPGEKEQAVLFVGNSYTYVNDLPGMLLRMSEADGARTAALSAQMLVRGGASLDMMRRRPDVMPTLASRHWDAVVLQERSDWATDPELVEESVADAYKWRDALRAAKTRVLLCQTWAPRRDSSWYRGGYAQKFKSDTVTEAKLDANSPALASVFGASVVPVGPTWRLARREFPAVELHGPDGTHPLERRTAGMPRVRQQPQDPSLAGEHVAIPEACRKIRQPAWLLVTEA